MKDSNPFLRAIDTLEQSKEHYLLIGGFAVVMHGYSRFTPDLNVLCAPDSESLARLCESLEKRGYQREGESAKSPECFRESFIDSQAPTFRIDLLVLEEWSFPELLRRSKNIQLFDHSTRIVSLADLIEMKSRLKRGQDKTDLVGLRYLQQLEGEGSSDIKVATEGSAELDKDQKQMIADFYQLPLEERLDWLTRMLAQLGQFCVV